MFVDKHTSENLAGDKSLPTNPLETHKPDVKVAEAFPLLTANKEAPPSQITERKFSEKIVHEVEPVHVIQAEPHPNPIVPQLEEAAPVAAHPLADPLNHASDPNTIGNHTDNHGHNDHHPHHDNHVTEKAHFEDKQHDHVADFLDHVPEVAEPKLVHETHDTPAPVIAPVPVTAEHDASNPSVTQPKSEKDSYKKKEATEDSLSARQPSERFKRQQEEKDKKALWEKEHPIIPKEKKPKTPRSISKGKKDNLLRKRKPEERDDDDKDNDQPNGDQNKADRDEEELGEQDDDSDDDNKAGKSPKSPKGRGKKLEKGSEKGRRGDSKKRESTSTKKGKGEEAKEKGEGKKGRSASKSAGKKSKGNKDDSGKDDNNAKGRKAIKTK